MCSLSLKKEIEILSTTMVFVATSRFQKKTLKGSAKFGGHSLFYSVETKVYSPIFAKDAEVRVIFFVP